MGRPMAAKEAGIFRYIEKAEPNAFNKLHHELPAAITHDLLKFKEKHKL